jgi:uncharacterized protein involved in outer membrane biogenesis
MRKLLIIVVVLLVLAAGLVLVAALSLNRVIDQNRDRILQRAQAAVGRDVAIERITVNVWGGLGIRLEKVRVAENPTFGDAPFVTADAVTAHAALWPLLRGEIEVGRVALARPEIRLIRDASGTWNYSTLKVLAPPAVSHYRRPLQVMGVAYAAADAAPQFLVSRATIADGTLTVVDRSRTPAQTTRVAHVDLDLTDLSLVTPIRFNLEAGVQSDTQNLDLAGTVGPVGDRRAIPIDVSGRIGPLPPDDLRVDDLRVQATVSPESVRLANVSGRTLGGSFTLSGQYPVAAHAALGLKGTLQGIAIPRALALVMKEAPQRLEGVGQLALDLRAAGNSAAAIESSLSGTVAAEVHDGEIKSFNIPSEVLGRVTGLPGIGDLISVRIKPKYGRLFTGKTTRFQELRGTFRLAERQVRTDDLAITADDYGVRMTGSITFDRVADLAGTLLMSPQFSADVAADVKEVKYLLTDSGQLAVGFRLRGRLGEAKPEPDSRQLAELLTRAAVRGGAAALVEKLLGSKRPAPQQPAPQPPADALEKGLRDLLGR